MHRALRALILLCSLHAVTAWGDASPVTISLGDAVTVEREQLTLGDIAHVSGAEPWRSRLDNLGLGPAPRAGLTRKVERESVVALVREHFGRSVTMTWEGASKVTVRRAAKEYSAETFVHPARDYLVRHLHEKRPDLSRVDVKPVSPLLPVSLPSGDLSLKLRPIHGDALAKRAGVWVDVSVNGKYVNSLPVWFAVSAYRPTMVAVRNLARLERLNADDTRVEERDVAGLSAEPVSAEILLSSMRARQMLAAGQTLLKTDVEPAPSVVRNQEIQVQVRSGGVVIETSGIAMQEGHVGDRVSVRNPGSQKDYLAQVISEGVVMVSAQ
jgi:flagella basal body P-ring formation protein FlgA